METARTPGTSVRELIALAVTGAKRSSAIPRLPTIGEAGVPDYELNSWCGVLAPGDPQSRKARKPAFR